MNETKPSLQGFVHSMVRGEDPAMGFPAAVGWRVSVGRCWAVGGDWVQGHLLSELSGLGSGEGGGRRRKRADIGASFLEVASLGLFKKCWCLGALREDPKGPFSRR